MMQKSKLDNYNSPRGASAYKSDYQTKVHRKVSDTLERRIFARLFAGLGEVGSLLDLPCGAGRLYSLLAERSPRVYEADWSFTMVGLNRDDHQGAASGYLRCSALQIPFADRAVDVVVSVRLSHHLETVADREQHLRELCRVARKAVIVTYFSHYSLKNWLRRLRAPFNRKSPKHTLRTAQVAAFAQACGYRLTTTIPLSLVGSGHVFALLRRHEPV